MLPACTSRKGNFPTMDLLSNFPLEIIANILGRLPIREAIQTFILSRQWRHKWRSMTRLYFDNECVTLADDDDDSSFDDVFVNFVDRVLLYHRGTVHEFIIATEAEPNISDLNRWVYYASCNNVRELSIEFIHDDMVPSSLFQCSKLMSLYLGCCNIFKLPVGFDEFMSLKSLHSLETLVSMFPILESLKFSESDMKVVSVHASLLKYFHHEGEGDRVVLQRTPLVRELSVSRFIVPTFIGVIVRILKCPQLPLGVSGLSMDLNFEDPIQVLHLLKFMDRSPILEDIRIRAHGRGTPLNVSLLLPFPRKLGMLLSKLLLMVSYGSTNETEFMKLLLLNAPVLEEMLVTLWCAPEEQKKKVGAELLSCSWETEVVCCGF